MVNAPLNIPMPVILPLLPEIVVAVAAMAILIGDLFLSASRKMVSAYAAIATCVVAIGLLVALSSADADQAFYGLFILDPLAGYSKLLILLATIVSVVISLEPMKNQENSGEYYVLMLFGALGMMLMVSADSLIMVYLGLELMALCTYILVGYQRNVLRSSEAALKYVVLGALASCMLLYGISFIYGLTGTLDLGQAGAAISALGKEAQFALLVGMMFMLAGLLFKVSAAPFHMWTPDAYEGAPTAITAFMSVAPKVAGFVMFIRILETMLPGMHHQYVLVLSVVAVLTMAVGNLAAIAQRNIKRMLAYSTIGHAGIMLLGLIAGNQGGHAAILVYLSIYLFMSMGAFAIINLMQRNGQPAENIDDFAGLSRAHPGYALAMGLFMFSLAGIPPLAGFWAKYAVFAAAIQAGYLGLAIIGILFSVVGAFYYIRIVKIIYFDAERDTPQFVESQPVQVTIAVAALAVVLLGVAFNPLMELCKTAAAGVL